MKKFILKRVIFPNTIIRFQKLAIRRSQILTLDLREDSVVISHTKEKYLWKDIEIISGGAQHTFFKYLSSSKYLKQSLKTLRHLRLYNLPSKEDLRALSHHGDIQSLVLSQRVPETFGEEYPRFHEDEEDEQKNREE